LKCKQVEANVEQSDPTILLWFFLRKGGREINVEIGINKKIFYGSKKCKTGRKQRQNWEKVGKFVEHKIYTLRRCSKQHSKKREERRKKKLSIENYRGGNGNE
jgi:hypothetical protein